MYRMLERNTMQDDTPAKIDEETPPVFVYGEEESAVRRGGDAGDVGRGLKR